MKPILDFKTFQRIFEADEPTKEGISAIAPLVLSLYFQAYGELASKVEGYKDVVKDLQSIMKAEVDKKPEVIEGISVPNTGKKTVSTINVAISPIEAIRSLHATT